MVLGQTEIIHRVRRYFGEKEKGITHELLSHLLFEMNPERLIMREEEE
jgi:hypothetical protein